MGVWEYGSSNTPILHHSITPFTQDARIILQAAPPDSGVMSLGEILARSGFRPA